MTGCIGFNASSWTLSRKAFSSLEGEVSFTTDHVTVSFIGSIQLKQCGSIHVRLTIQSHALLSVQVIPFFLPLLG